MSSKTEEKIEFISIKKCKKIGEGMFSEVFDLANKTIVKVMSKQTPFDDIVYEYEISKKAHEIGMPCPKTYGIVQTELGYGIVYEKIEGMTLNKYLKKHPKMYEIYAEKYAKLLRKINEIRVEKTEFESIKQIYFNRIKKFAKYGLTQEQVDFLKQVINLVPEENCLLHGDPRLTNVMITTEGKLIFIDLDNLSYGNPLFDVCTIYYTLFVMAKRHWFFVEIANGIGYQKSLKFWQIFMINYFGTNHPETLKFIEKICEILARLREITYLNKPKPKFGVLVDSYIQLVKEKFFENKEETIKLIKQINERK